MPTLPTPTNGVIQLPTGVTTLDDTIVVWRDLHIQGAPGARLEWAGVGPMIVHRAGRLRLTNVTLARVDGYDGLIRSSGRLVAENVVFEGAVPWHALPEPRPPYSAGGAKCDGAVHVTDRGHLTARACAWVRNRAPVLLITGSARGTVQGGAFGDAAQPGFVVSGRGRLSLQRVHAHTLDGPVSMSGTQASLKMGRCRIEAPDDTAVTVWGGDATLSACTLTNAHTGLRIHAGDVHIRRGDVSGCAGNGLRITGPATVNMTDVVVQKNGWAGVSIGGTARLTMTGGATKANCFGLFPAAAAQIQLTGVEVRDNTRFGIAARDDVHVKESSLDVGPHPEGDRAAWHRVQWEGADLPPPQLPEDERLSWVVERLQSTSESPESRAMLLDSLPDLLAPIPHGPWWATNLLGARAYVASYAWAAAAELLHASPDPAAAQIREATQTPAPTSPLLAPERCIVFRQAPLSIALPAADKDALWVGDMGGNLWSVRPDGATLVHTFPGPFVGAHQRGSRLAVHNATDVWLLDLPTNTVVGTWVQRSEDVKRVSVIDPDTVDVDSLQTSGHPTDRSGVRRRARIGEPLPTGRGIAWAQGRVPVLGGVGDCSSIRDEPIDPTHPRPGHPTHHISRTYAHVSWVHHAGPDAQWTCPDQPVGMGIVDDAVLVAAADKVWVLRCVDAAPTAAIDPAP